MKKITLADIRALSPCTDPAEYVTEDWTGTVLDILALDNVPAQNRIWVACHTEFLSPKTLRLFAVACARNALKFVHEPDKRSIEACDVAERFAYGEATREELDAARSAAYAAYAAAYAAADATDAARSAAYAAYAAAYAAADATDAAYAAYAAARASAIDARKKQVVMLRELIQKWEVSK